jgi:hypothetical protein
VERPTSQKQNQPSTIIFSTTNFPCYVPAVSRCMGQHQYMKIKRTLLSKQHWLGQYTLNSAVRDKNTERSTEVNQHNNLLCYPHTVLCICSLPIHNRMRFFLPCRLSLHSGSIAIVSRTRLPRTNENTAVKQYSYWTAQVRAEPLYQERQRERTTSFT